jgi:predicted nucleic acid-binding Zn ribbon protein
MRFRQPQRLDSILNKVLKKYQLKKGIELYRSLFIWSEVVGEEINKHTIPLKVKYDKLYVLVDTPVWADTINLLKPQILTKLNQRLGKQGLIKDIHLRIGDFYRFKHKE